LTRRKFTVGSAPFLLIGREEGLNSFNAAYETKPSGGDARNCGGSCASLMEIKVVGEKKKKLQEELIPVKGTQEHLQRDLLSFRGDTLTHQLSASLLKQ